MTRYGMAALLAALVVGCGGDAPDDSLAEAQDSALVVEQDSFPESTPGMLPPSRNPDVPQGSVGAREDGEVVTASVTPEGLTLDRESLPQGGQVTFVLRNTGSEARQLHVRLATGGQWKSMAVQPGGEVEMSMVLTAGSYDVMAPPASGGEAPASLRKKLVIR